MNDNNYSCTDKRHSKIPSLKKQIKFQKNFCGFPPLEMIENDIIDNKSQSPWLDDSNHTYKNVKLNEKNVLTGYIEDDSNNINKLISSISYLATKRDISLRMFKIISKKKFTNKIEKTAFKTACSVLIDSIKTYNLPRFVKNKTHLQQMLNGKFYLSRGESGFENFTVQENVKYGGVIYIIKPIKPLDIFEGVLTETYIGVTWKTLKERFIEHTADAIESYLTNFDFPNRLIEYLILKVLEAYITKNHSNDLELSPLNDYFRLNFLGREMWEKKAEIERIAMVLYNQYFNMEIIEVHRNYETAWARERWYIKNFQLNINREYYRGTLYPNGLNMVLSPEKPGYRTLPLYDIVFLICLGFTGPEINEKLSTYYHININFRTIYHHLNKFWESWDNILKLFFRLIMQKLLEHKEYLWMDIAKTLHRASSYRVKKNYKKWFYGLNVTQLRDLMKKPNFNWCNLKELANEFKNDFKDQNTVKGIPREIWVEWFIRDIGMEEIAKILGYKNVDSFRNSWLKQDRVSVFQKEFDRTYTMAVRKYRKKRAIELLTDEDFIESLLDSRLYWIYVKEFNFMCWKDYAVDRPSQGLRNCVNFFENLFNEEGFTFDYLEDLTALNSIKDEKKHKIIQQILYS
jgi:hypothetical protein